MATVKIQYPVKIDNDGLTTAALTIREEIVSKQVNTNTDKHSLLQDNKEIQLEAIILSFDCETVKKDNFRNIESYIFNLSYSPNIVEKKRIKTKMVNIYNRFTTVLLRLGIISENDLEKARKNMDDIDPDVFLSELLAIKNLPVKFRIVKNKKGFDEVDIMSLIVTGEMGNND